jgi:DNA-binding beta-propeller fold protein YncE
MCSACSFTDLDGLTKGGANADAGALVATTPNTPEMPPDGPEGDDEPDGFVLPMVNPDGGGANNTSLDASTEPGPSSPNSGPVAEPEVASFSAEAGTPSVPEPEPAPLEPEPAAPEPEPAPPEPEPETEFVPDAGGDASDSGTASFDAALPPDEDESWLYWLAHGDDTVGRAALDGSNANELFRRPGAFSYFRSIAVAAEQGYIFFTDDERGEVVRAELDGDNAVVILEDMDDPVGIDLDESNSKLYVVDQGDLPRVYRANLDGSDVEVVLEAGLLHPYGIALDVDGDRLYVIDNDADDVFTARLDGSEFAPLGIPGMVAPIEIALDAATGTLYWCDIGPPPVIRAARIDGTEVRDVLTPSTFLGLEIPLGITFDTVTQRLYYVEGGTLAALLSVNVDGSDVQTLVDGLDEPVGIEVAHE